MCGLCSKQVCKHCREDITGKKETHTCDPNIVANIKAMYEDAVPCPKCKEPISRISGCSHMFCTWCHTGFDYKTGLIIDAKHNTNPHFYRWQAAQAQLPRVAAQLPRTDVCATPAHTAYLIDEKIRSIYGNECYKYYRNALHLFCNNITSLIGECQGRIVQPYGPEHNRMSRIKYLAGLQSEKELARDAMKEYKRVMYEVECIQLKQMLSTTLTDWLRTFAQFVDTECNSDTNLFKEPILNIPNELVAYYNCEALKLAKAFDYSCYQEASIRLYMYRRERSKIKDPYIEVIMLNDCKTKVLVTSIPSSKFNSNECKASGWTITTKPI